MEFFNHIHCKYTGIRGFVTLYNDYLRYQDLKLEFAFAHSYTNLSSQSTSDFFEKLKRVAPFSIKRIQTDNGAGFHKRFRDNLEKQGIIQFFNYPRRPQ